MALVQDINSRQNDSFREDPNDSTKTVRKVTATNPDGSNIGGASTTPTDFEGSPVTVGTTAVELTFTGTTQTISIKSASTNTGIIWFGDATIDNTGANAIGELTADSAVEIGLDDASAPLYVVSDTAGQKVYKAALT